MWSFESSQQIHGGKHQKGLCLHPFKKDTLGLQLEAAAGSQTHAERLGGQTFIKVLVSQLEISMGDGSLQKGPPSLKREKGGDLI